MVLVNNPGSSSFIYTLGIEAQWRWTCECGVLIGYQGYPYDLPDPEDKGGKTLFYILNDAVVQDTKMSKLIQELAKHQS